MSRLGPRSAWLRGVGLGGGGFGAGLALTFAIGQLGLDGGIELWVSLHPLRGTLMGYSLIHLWPIIYGPTAASLAGWTVAVAGLLVIAGYTAASLGQGRISDGARIAAGYGVVTLVTFGVMLGTVTSGSLRVTQSTNFLVGVLVIGLVYPVVFGGLGGLIASRR